MTHVSTAGKVCCSVLQCVAVCCSVLQCVAHVITAGKKQHAMELEGFRLAFKRLK